MEHWREVSGGNNQNIGSRFRVGMPCAFYWPKQLLLESLFIDLESAQDVIHVKGRPYWQILLYFEYEAFYQWVWGYYFKCKICAYAPRTSPTSAFLGEDISIWAAFSQQDDEDWKELNSNRTLNKRTLRSKFHLFQTKNPLLKDSLGMKILISLPVCIQMSIFCFRGWQIILQLVFLIRNGTVIYQLFYAVSRILVTHCLPKNCPLDSQIGIDILSPPSCQKQLSMVRGGL